MIQLLKGRQSLRLKKIINCIDNIITLLHYYYNCSGSRKPITSYNLKAVTNDIVEVENRTIVFTIANSPKLGRLIHIFSENNVRDISSFTQSMVSVHLVRKLEACLIYKHFFIAYYFLAGIFRWNMKMFGDISFNFQNSQ